MTPFASVAMLEKLALLKIAFCRAPAFRTAWVCTASGLNSADSFVLLMVVRMSPRLRGLLIPAVYITPSPSVKLRRQARRRCRRQSGSGELRDLPERRRRQ